MVTPRWPAAYGRCGQLQRAFGTADELLQLGHPLTAELACVLLQACISDTQQGFRHALLVSALGGRSLQGGRVCCCLGDA